MKLSSLHLDKVIIASEVSVDNISEVVFFIGINKICVRYNSYTQDIFSITFDNGLEYYVSDDEFSQGIIDLINNSIDKIKHRNFR